MIAAGGLVWVTGVDDGVAAYEPRTGERVATVPIDGDMCGAPDAGFGSLWIPTGGPAAIHRVALGSRTLVASIAVALPAEGEFTIGAGERGVWAIVHRPDGARRLARLDPGTERIGDLFDVAAGAVSVRVGHGSVWMACPGDDEVRRVDPATGAVIRAFTTGRRPRFLVVGPEGVWVVNQLSGSVTHIDPVSDEVVATISVDDGPLRGGDVALGAGSVWVRGTSEMVTRIDPESHAVVARYGAPTAGSASVAVLDGQLWISSGAEATLSRIDLAS